MSLKRNILSNYSGNIALLIINFLLVPVYLKFLTAEEYGLIVFFTTLVSSFVVLDMGLGLTINREVASSVALNNSSKQTADIIRSFESIYWALAVVIGVFLNVFAEWISINWLNVENINQDQLKFVIRLIGFALMVRWPISFYDNVMSGFQKMFPLNLIKIVVGILNISVLYSLFYYFDIGIAGYFIFLVSLYFFHVSALICNIWRTNSLDFWKAKFRFDILKKSKTYILGIGFYSIIGTLYVIIDKLLISKAFLTTELAYYSLISMATLSIVQLVYPISSALFPKFVEYYKKEKIIESFHIFRRGYQLIMVLVFSFSAILVLFGKSIILIWTQNEIITENSIIYLKPLLLGTVFYCLHILIVSIYTALGKTKLVNIVYIITFSLYVVLLSFSLLENNLLWIAYSWLLSNIILMLLSVVLAFKLLGYTRFKLFIKQDIVLPLLIFLIIVITSNYIAVPYISVFNSIVLIVVSLVGFLILFSLCSSHLRSIIYLRVNNERE